MLQTYFDDVFVARKTQGRYKGWNKAQKFVIFKCDPVPNYCNNNSAGLKESLKSCTSIFRESARPDDKLQI